MTLDEAYNCLNRLAVIHSDLRSSVDFSVEDRKRAIWYVQGAAISTGYAIAEMYKTGLAVSASNNWRYVNELRELAKLFENIKDDDRRVAAWYKGHVIEQRKGETFAYGLPANIQQEHTKVKNNLMNDLSKYVHPTIKVTRYNVYRTPTEEYNYDWKRLAEFDEILIVLKTAIICATHCLLVPARTLPVSMDVRTELNAMYATATSWSHE